MTKAEQRALERFPEEMTPLVYQEQIDLFGGKTEVDFNLLPRSFFQLGYEQAEKDLALTWEDMKRIIHIDVEMMYDTEVHPEWKEEQPYYEEVLRRFKKTKEEKK